VVGLVLYSKTPKNKNFYPKMISPKRKKRVAKAVSPLRTTLSFVSNPSPIVPEKMHAVLRFQYYEGLAGGANAYAYVFFSMNSPYDPLYSVGGGKCTGFEEWMTLYTRFYVSKCTISAIMYNGSNSPIIAYQLPVRSDEAGGGVTPTIDKIMEGKDGRYHYLSTGAHPANGRPLTVTYMPARFEGLPVVSNREELSGDVATDPDVQPAVQVGWLCPAGTAALTIAILATVEYTTMFYRPRLLGDS